MEESETRANAEAVLGGAATRTPTVAALSAFAAHTDCPTAAVALAVRADLDEVCAGTEYASSFGQDPQAFRRGETFERRVKSDDYALLIALLREHAGFPTSDLRVEDLRSRFQRNRDGLRQRASETRRLLAAIAAGDRTAPNIIDGAVLETTIAGRPAFFEADSVAAFDGGRIHVGEIKSFPKVDGRIDPDKLGAACDQAAWYVLLVRRALEAGGGDPAIVSDEVLIVTPLGVGLTPTLTPMNVARKVERAERLLSEAPDPAALTRAVPAGIGFPSVDDSGDARLAKLEGLLNAVGTAYRPECLADCGLARLCRERAFEAGAVQMTSAQVIRFLPGVRDLRRAAELSRGAAPTASESHAADLLARAGRLYDRATAGDAA
jgi:hypothetical protein